MKKKFEKIKKHYDDLHTSMLSQGRLMCKDTGIGFWGIAPSTELFDLFEKTNLKQAKSFIDLGSGDGRAALVASLFTKAIGIEYDEELHSMALEGKEQTKSSAKLVKGNYHEHKLSSYDYLFIHPDESIAKNLESKLKKEMKKSAKLVVYGPFQHPTTLQKIETHDIDGTLCSVYQRPQ